MHIQITLIADSQFQVQAELKTIRENLCKIRVIRVKEIGVFFNTVNPLSIHLFLSTNP